MPSAAEEVAASMAHTINALHAIMPSQELSVIRIAMVERMTSATAMPR